MRSYVKCSYTNWNVSVTTRLELRGHVTGERLNAFRVATLAQHVIVKRITAPPLGLRGQRQCTVLALIARNMETAIQSHHSHRLVLARLRHDRLLAHTATRRKFSNKKNKKTFSVKKHSKSPLTSLTCESPRCNESDWWRPR